MSEGSDQLSIAKYEEAVFRRCLVKGDVIFASGVRANNKMNLENLESAGHLTKETVRRVGKLAVGYDPEFVVGVPDGANWLARDIALEFDLELVILRATRTAKGKIMSFKGDNESTLRRLNRGVIVEDVFSSFTSTRKVMSLPGVSERAVSAVGVLDRGIGSDRQPLEIPYQAVLAHDIPPQLSLDSELWGYLDPKNVLVS